VIDPADVAGGKNRLIHRVHKRALARTLRSFRGIDVLDFGCGTGRLSEWMAAHGAQVEGVDVTSEMIEVARRRAPGIQYRVIDGVTLPYDDCRFDVVVVVYVLQYLEGSHEQIVRELARVLRPSGIIVAIEQAADDGLGRGRPVAAYGDLLEANGFSNARVSIIRVSDSLVVGTAHRHPFVSRMAGISSLVMLEAAARGHQTLTGGRYVDVLAHATKA
jgi:SAM-dependent methyltransferase